MILPIRRRPAAQEDILEIWAFIAKDSVRAADRLLDRFDAILETIAENPHSGRSRTELGRGIRSLPAGNYVLYYRASESEIELVRVRSRYRDTGPSDVS